MSQKRPRMTVTPEQLKRGELCTCEACVRDGAHEPECPVHEEPSGECACGRAGQNKAAG